MKTSIEIRADILKTVWSQDYQGVETIRSSVYNVISALTVASFALSSFLLKDIQHGPRSIRVATDILIVFFIWIVFLLLKRDLRNRRKCLILRQELIESLDQHATGDFKVFADTSKVKLDIKDDDLFWIPLASTLVI